MRAGGFGQRWNALSSVPARADQPGGTVIFASSKTVTIASTSLMKKLSLESSLEDDANAGAETAMKIEKASA
jgi:hypothetical protein